MEQIKKFQASNGAVEVKGSVIIDFVKAVELSVNSRLATLKKYGIVDVEASKWYSQQSWLNALKDVDAIGVMSIRITGQNIVKKLKFPDNVKTFKDAFVMLNQVYQSSHRNGYVGFYKMVSYDEKKKEIRIETNTAYPEEFDNGVLLELWRRFKPKGAAFTIKSEYSINQHGGLLYMLSW